MSSSNFYFACIGDNGGAGAGGGVVSLGLLALILAACFLSVLGWLFGFIFVDAETKKPGQSFGFRAAVFALVGIPCLTLLWLLPSSRSSGFTLRPEVHKNASIFYDKGKETMFLSVEPDIGKSATKAVWLFPLPSAPEKVSAKIIRELPGFSGTEMSSELRTPTAGVSAAISGTTTVPVAPPVMYLCTWLLGMVRESINSGGEPSTDYSPPPGPLYIEPTPGVRVFSHLEQYGLTLETVSCDSPGAMKAYFGSKKLDWVPRMDEITRYYLGPQSTFVLIWISSPEQVKQSEGGHPYMATKVSFPSSKIYIPLKVLAPPSLQFVPHQFYIYGLAKPEIPVWLWPFSHTSYYENIAVGASPELAAECPEIEAIQPSSQGAFGTRKENHFTKVEINASSVLLGRDIYLEPGIAASKYYWTKEISDRISRKPTYSYSSVEGAETDEAMTDATVRSGQLFRSFRIYAGWSFLMVPVSTFVALLITSMRYPRALTVSDWFWPFINTLWGWLGLGYIRVGRSLRKSLGVSSWSAFPKESKNKFYLSLVKWLGGYLIICVFIAMFFPPDAEGSGRTAELFLFVLGLMNLGLQALFWTGYELCGEKSKPLVFFHKTYWMVSSGIFCIAYVALVLLIG